MLARADRVKITTIRASTARHAQQVTDDRAIQVLEHCECADAHGEKGRGRSSSSVRNVVRV